MATRRTWLCPLVWGLRLRNPPRSSGALPGLTGRLAGGWIGAVAVVGAQNEGMVGCARRQRKEVPQRADGQ
jgi:hypothetical protein